MVSSSLQETAYNVICSGVQLLLWHTTVRRHGHAAKEFCELFLFKLFSGSHWRFLQPLANRLHLHLLGAHRMPLQESSLNAPPKRELHLQDGR